MSEDSSGLIRWTMGWPQAFVRSVCRAQCGLRPERFLKQPAMLHDRVLLRRTRYAVSELDIRDSSRLLRCTSDIDKTPCIPRPAFIVFDCVGHDSVASDN